MMKRILFILSLMCFLTGAGYAQTDPVGCLNVEYPSLNPFPSATFLPACTGQDEFITHDAHLMEYSMVQVTEGTEYTFSLSATLFYVTISDENGTEVLAGGTTPVTWTADFSGLVRFYSHFNSDCGLDKDTGFNHARKVQCGSIVSPTAACEELFVPSNNLETYYSLSNPLAIDIPVGDEAITIYGIEPTLVGEGTSFEFTIYGNNNGFLATANVIGTRTGSLVDTELLGTKTGMDYIKHSILFDEPLELDANTTYWIAMTCDATGWETNSQFAARLGNPDNYNYGGNTWMQLYPNRDLVFNLICENPSPDNSACEQYFVLSNNRESYYTLSRPLAFDIPVGDDAITVYGIEPTLAGEGTSFEFTIYGNNNGYVATANVIGTRTGRLLNAEMVGTKAGTDYYKHSIAFDSPLELDANTTYWIAMTCDATGWETNSQFSDRLGNPDNYNYGGNTWMQLYPNRELVFNLLCEASEPDNSACELYFTPSNNLENYYTLSNPLAIDIPVGNEAITIYGIEPTLVGEGTSFEFTIYGNNNGYVAASNVIGTRTGSLVDAELLGTKNGMDYFKHSILFDEPLELDANATYWIAMASDATGWETNSQFADRLGNPDNYNIGGSTWMQLYPNRDLVFNLICEGQAACQDLQIGEGTTPVMNFPLSCYFNYSYSQQLFTASEIGDFGEDVSITSLSFQHTDASVITKSDITVYLGNTDKTSYSNTVTSEWVPTSQLREVWSGDVELINGWVTITFDVPFRYTGSSLVVAILNDDGVYQNRNERFLWHSTGSNNMGLIYENDNDPFNMNSPANPSGMADYRNNFIFEICPTSGLLQVDMQAFSVEGDTNPMVGKAYNYTVTVRNNGDGPASNYTVKLITEDGEVLAQELVAESLAPGYMKAVALSHTFAEIGALNIKGRVEIADDGVAWNDESEPLALLIVPAGVITIEVGTGNVGSGAIPHNFMASHGASQTVYQASDIDQEDGGLVTQLTYRFDSMVSVRDNVKIYMANTSLSNLATPNNWVPLDDFVLVYEGSISVPTGVNDVVIDFQTPFVYEGGNLSIMWEKPRGENYYGIVRCITSSTPNVRSRTYSGSEQFDGTQTGTTYALIPNIKMLMDVSTPGSMSGTVTSSGNPVEDVKLVLEPHNLNTTTAVDGTYSFPHIPAGEYIVTASKHGYFDMVEDLEITAGEDLQKNIAIDAIPLHQLSITVTNVDGSPVEDAEVEIVGYEGYSATTSASGICTFQAYEADGYSITVSKIKMVTFTDEFDLTANKDINVILEDNVYAPFNVMAAENADGGVDITWVNPADAFPFTYTLDDGSFEGGWSMSSDLTANFGNLYATEDIGVITSVDVYGVSNFMNTDDRQVYLYIFDAEGELVAQSGGFMLPSNGWINVPMPSVPFDGAFYAMVHWPDTSGETNYVGYDQSGPYTNDNLAWYNEGVIWAPFPEVAPSNPGLFMIRVNALSSENKSTSYGYANTLSDRISHQSVGNVFSSTDAASVVDNPPALASEKDTRSMENFKVWRMNPADQANEASWDLLTPTAISSAQYTDEAWSALDLGVYQYAVKAVYTNDILSPAAFSNTLQKEVAITLTWEAAAGETKTVEYQVAGGGEFTVDWGDGSATETIKGEDYWQMTSHSYTAAGTYNVKFISASESSQITSIDIWNAGMTSIDLSEAKALTFIGCADNKLAKLDLSGLTAITDIYCSTNELTELDLSGLTALKNLYCFSNNLTSIDVTGFADLKNLHCYTNELADLKVSGCSSLLEIKCGSNQLTELDASGLSAMTTLWCNNNLLETLLVDGCTSLKLFDCNNNELVGLDASSLTAVTTINAYNNKMTTLDVSDCPSLFSLACYNNRLQLSELYAVSETAASSSKKLGTQTLVPQTATAGEEVDFSAQNEFGGIYTVFEVEKDSSPAVAGEDYTSSDGIIIFLGEGNYKVTMTNEAIISTSDYPAMVIAEYDVDPMPMTEAISFTWRGNAFIAKSFSIAATEGEMFSINWGGGQTTTHTGEGPEGQVVAQPESYGDTEDYTVVISVAGDCEITGLAIFNKQVSALDVSACESLEGLSCYRNQLTELDLTNNTKLTELYCHENSLADLDVTNCTVLSNFDCSFNQLESLDVSSCTALTGLFCNGNSLSELDVANNTALLELICDMNELTALDVSNCTALTFLSLSYNSVSNLDVSENTVLKQLFCDDNGISTLDITSNTSLTHLYCTSNSLSELDLSKNTALSVLHIYNNELNRIDISSNPSLTALHYFNNRLPLSDLYTGSQLMETEGNTVIPGRQTHLEQAAEAFGAVSLAGEMVLGGFETDIAVKKGEDNAVEGVDYSLDYAAETLTFLAEGNYEVTLANDEAIAYAFQRAQVIMPFKVEGTGIADIAALDMRIYPNPTNGQLRIANNGLDINKITVYDAYGRAVHGESNQIAMQGEISVDISELPSGIYYVRLETDKGMQTTKVIKL